MIDHADVRELLELAAAEPGGLDRLAAGDTVDAAAVAGHLVGCPSCAEEARRLAALQLGNAEVVRSNVADVRTTWLDVLWREIRVGVRFRVFGIVEVEHGLALVEPARDGSDVVA